MKPAAALIYNPATALHNTGFFTIENDGLLYHRLGNQVFLDEVYKPAEINYPYPFPNSFDHPENNARIESVLKAFENWGLLERFQVVEAIPATEAEVLTTHTQAYLEELKAFCQLQSGGFAGEATPISEQSYAAALMSAGAALTAGRAVLSGNHKRAFAFSRPPGHHAGRQKAAGFCLFNNAAVLANYALTQPGIERILLIDWDVHHGNGTQEIFWQNRQVLFNSYHQFGPKVYPESGAANEIGEGDGRGYTVNVPLPPDCTDALYLAAFEKVTGALAAQFQPDLIIVSAGMDGHFADLRHLYLWEEGSGFGLTAQLYHRLTRFIIELSETYCAGRCVFLQEGGYNLTNLANSLLNLAAALLDLPILIAEYLATQELLAFDLDTIIAPLRANLKDFWDFTSK